MTRQAPPPVIDSSRVVSYAFVDDVGYRESGALYAAGKLLGAVPCLAICIQLGEAVGPKLLHCDQQWNVLGISGAGTVDEIKGSAEKNYPGVSSRWVDLNTSVVDALSYYDQQFGDDKCSFCGRRSFEIESWVDGNGARICNICIASFRKTLKESI